MSDEESYEYHYSDASDNDEQMSEAEESFLYTDDDEPSQNNSGDLEVNLENSYYNGKQMRDTAYEQLDSPPDDDDSTELISIPQAIAEFEKTIEMEDTIGEWRFKCLKQIIKIHIHQRDFKSAKKVYQRLLECISHPELQGVTPNAIEKGIHRMLDRVSSILNSANEDTEAQSLAKLVYDSTLSMFHPSRGSCPNERLWFKTNLKYGQLLFDGSSRHGFEVHKLQSVIYDLLHTSGLEDTPPENRSSSNSTHLMEIYALQIQLYSKLKDNIMLREIFAKAKAVRGGIPHPRTLALIQELGGKMHMSSKDYEEACIAFFEAFKSYDEAGDVGRLRCLKYLVLASMLGESSINPFDSQEVRPYKHDPEIRAMTKLVDSFHSNDIKTFDRILDKNEGHVMDDEFIREYIADLRETIRKQVLLDLVKPYTRISLEALSKELNGISVKEIDGLLVPLILDGKLDGRIDQVNGILVKSVDRLGTKSNTSTAIKEESKTTESKKKKSVETKLPEWGSGSIACKTIDAMELLMQEMANLTSTVAGIGIMTQEKRGKPEEFGTDFRGEFGGMGGISLRHGTA